MDKASLIEVDLKKSERIVSALENMAFAWL